MKSFKINLFTRSGNLYIRSRFNSDRLIKKSSGLPDNQKNRNILQTDISKAYNSLKDWKPEERKKKYGSAVIDLDLIWSRYLDQKGELPIAKDIEGADNVLQALNLFPQTHSNKSKDYTRLAKQVHTQLSYFFKNNGIEGKFRDLNRATLQQYDNYLATEKTEFICDGEIIKKVPLASGTRKKHFVILKAVANYYNGIADINPEIHKYSVTEINKPSRALEWEEIKKIMNYDPKSKTESLTKDIFLFSCFTGIRITAALNLKASDISGGFINWINTKTKNQNVVSTTIHRFNAPIIQKYKDKGNLFPEIAQQTLNSIIKDICRDAEILNPDEVHNHTGRHSYNSLLYSLGIDTFIRNEEVGHAHSTINERVYTKIDEQQRKTIIVRTFENLESILQERKKDYTTEFDNL